MGKAEEELAHAPLQAILLADSFDTQFQPITLESPKVLLPLVNVPMIDYTLEWLEYADVKEVFVFCCAHSELLIDFLRKYNWLDQPNFSVTTIISRNVVGVGDALRLIYERHVIHGDFILVSGDTVSNMSLTQAVKEHKERRRKDSNAVITMVIKLSRITRESRLGTEELIMAIDSETKQLLYYEESGDNSRGYLSLDKAVLADNTRSMSLHSDKQDCYIDICSPEVLSLFTDNFDYQHVRRDLVKGLLDDDIMGYKIFTHEIHAARIDNFRSYDTVSKDIMQRWTYPFVPDIQFSENSGNTRLERQGMYRAPEVKQSSSAKIGPFIVIGTGTSIGDNTKISNSVVGEGCTIGSNVTIEDSYIWNNVTIEDNCKLKHSIVCDGVIMKFGAALEPGVVLSFNVKVCRNFVVPAYSKVSLLQQPMDHDSSDEELENCADYSSGITEMLSMSCTLDELHEEQRTKLPDFSEVGDGEVGFIWSAREDEWRRSIAPVPVDKLMQIINDEEDILNEDGGAIPPPPGELEPDSTTNDSNEADSTTNDSNEDAEDIIDEDAIEFEEEVEATFRRAVEENVKDYIILEVNALRLSYNKTSADCAGALFYLVMKLALDTPHTELVDVVATTIKTWKKLLRYYMPSIDEEIEVLLKFEEMCLESAKEYSPLFSDILELLYQNDIIQEEAILEWASEKEGAEESDKIFVKQSQNFIRCLLKHLKKRTEGLRQ